MYLILDVLGKQYKIFEGVVININLISFFNLNDIFFVNKILLLSNQKGLIILNNNILNKIIIVCRFLKLKNCKKIRLLKFKRRKHYKKFKNFKSKFIELFIEKIKFNFI